MRQSVPRKQPKKKKRKKKANTCPKKEKKKKRANVAHAPKKSKQKRELVFAKKRKKEKPTLLRKTIGCIFVYLTNHTLSLSFLPILIDLKRKHLSLTIYFLSFPPNQIHSKKVLFSIFSSKFS